MSDTVTYTQKLRDENKRLREALRIIRGSVENYSSHFRTASFALGYIDDVARKALEGDSDE